jgi:hypothetical protein
MSGALVKLDEYTIGTAQSSVILAGGSASSSGNNVVIDNTFDVYIIKYSSVTVTTDGNHVKMRVTVGGVPDTTTNYDNYYEGLRSDSATSINGGAVNETSYGLGQLDQSAGKNASGTLTLFNFSDASEYSAWTTEAQYWWNGSSNILSILGGAFNTVNQACDGVQIFSLTENLESGVFKIYGLRK